MAKYSESDLSALFVGGATDQAGRAGEDPLRLEQELDGGAKDDTLDGGAGADAIEAGGGDDVVDGGSGADLIEGERGDDTLEGGKGDDTLDGGSGDDLLIGGSGGDTYVLSRGDDTIQGYKAGDQIVLSQELVDAGLSRDAVTVERTVIDGKEAAFLRFEIEGESFTTTVIGVSDAVEEIAIEEIDTEYDTLEGGEGADEIEAGGGDDVVAAIKGDDTLDGGNGDDLLIGGKGGDTYELSRGNDTIQGYKAGDQIVLSDDLISAGLTRGDVDVERSTIKGKEGAYLSFQLNDELFTTTVIGVSNSEEPIVINEPNLDASDAAKAYWQGSDGDDISDGENWKYPEGSPDRNVTGTKTWKYGNSGNLLFKPGNQKIDIVYGGKGMTIFSPSAKTTLSMVSMEMIPRFLLEFL